jgi:hypothetical protein
LEQVNIGWISGLVSGLTRAIWYPARYRISKKPDYPAAGYRVHPLSTPSLSSTLPHILSHTIALIHTIFSASPSLSSTLHSQPIHHSHPHCILSQSIALIHTTGIFSATPLLSSTLYSQPHHCSHPHYILSHTIALIHTIFSATPVHCSHPHSILSHTGPLLSSTLHSQPHHWSHPRYILSHTIALIHTAFSATPSLSSTSSPSSTLKS